MANFIDEHRRKVVLFQQQYRKRKSIKQTLEVPKTVFQKCPFCNELVLTSDLEKSLYVCPLCGNYLQLTARKRLETIVDSDSFCEMDQDLRTLNPLAFPGYQEKVESFMNQTGENEAFISGLARIGGKDVAIGVMDSYFMMGSMGSVVGEKVTRLIEVSMEKKLPLIIISASGGARMQEGIYSLMQMAKTAQALARHHEEKLLYISVLTHPTTGGVSASFAMLGDINIAEKDALIGFAGKRVIAQTIKEELPEGFQRADFLLEHGLLDMVVERRHLRDILDRLLKLHERGELHYAK